MSNMSYCRFENTANDLADCIDHFDNVANLADSEARYRLELIEMAAEIVNNWGYEIETP